MFVGYGFTPGDVLAVLVDEGDGGVGHGGVGAGSVPVVDVFAGDDDGARGEELGGFAFFLVDAFAFSDDEDLGDGVGVPVVAASCGKVDDSGSSFGDDTFHGEGAFANEIAGVNRYGLFGHV